MTIEADIPPPRFAVAARFNQLITDYYFSDLVRRFLWPRGLDALITSTYRTPERNAEVGGAKNSAHVHGLAEDFVITRGGKRVSEAEERQLFAELIKPNWPGYALHEGDHIHVNLSRALTPSSSVLALVAAGAVLAPLAIEIFRGFSKKKGRPYA